MKQTVVLCRCPETKKLFGVRMDLHNNGVWKAAWAFPLKESTAKNEGYGEETINYTGELDEEYPGCPYCESKSFIRCGKCGKLTCNVGQSYFHCTWCGSSGKISYASSIDFSTGNM